MIQLYPIVLWYINLHYGLYIYIYTIVANCGTWYPLASQRHLPVLATALAPSAWWMQNVTPCVLELATGRATKNG